MDTALKVKEENLEEMIAQEEDKRALLTKYVKDNLVEGTDFYKLQIGGRTSKPSLSKSGSEKVISLFHWIAEFTKDDETWEMLGRPAGTLCYKCILTSPKGIKLGEGRGASSVAKNQNDVNKTIKMAEKSAQIDAVLRSGGLSDVFTQDIEDMKEDVPVVQYGEPKKKWQPIKKDVDPFEVIKGMLKTLKKEPRTLGEAKKTVMELTDFELNLANVGAIELKLGELLNGVDPLAK